MEREELEIKDVERSFRQRMKDFFVGAKDKYYDIKLSMAEKKNMRIVRKEYKNEKKAARKEREIKRLEAENYNRLDLAKNIAYTSTHGVFACGFASIAIVSAVALTPINVFLALPLTAVTFGAAWFCKNNFNESKTEFKDMLEKYNENNKEAKELKQAEKEAKKAKKKAKKIAKKLDKANRPSLFERIVNKFKKHGNTYEELDKPEFDNEKSDEEELSIPEPEKIKKSKINGVTINPVTKKVTVSGLKIKRRKGLGIYEVILPKDDKMANSLADQLLKQYENKFGPMGITSDALNMYPWAWDNRPWPWEK